MASTGNHVGFLSMSALLAPGEVLWATRALP
jgi:hypothetical protein